MLFFFTFELIYTLILTYNMLIGIIIVAFIITTSNPNDKWLSRWKTEANVIVWINHDIPAKEWWNEKEDTRCIDTSQQMQAKSQELNGLWCRYHAYAGMHFKLTGVLWLKSASFSSSGNSFKWQCYRMWWQFFEVESIGFNVIISQHQWQKVQYSIETLVMCVFDVNAK